jgi:hypothetical protein
MRWWITTIVGYALLVFVLIVAVQYVSRAAARPLPFGLGGGPRPGTVELMDRDNRLLDEDRVGDIRSIRDVQFFDKEEKATFVYAKNGEQRLVTLHADD